MQQTLLLMGALSVAALTAFIVALSVGSVDTDVMSVWSALFGNLDDPMQTRVIMDLRLPRAGAAFVTGGLLALAGTLMQVLLRNPLADPYILGVSGGAAVGALGAMLLGLGGWLISSSAFVGALLSISIVFVAARNASGWDGNRLLLTGVVVAAGWGALISLLLAVSDDQSLRPMVFWLMGDLERSTGFGWALGVLLVGTITAMLLARNLNVLAFGDTQASTLGVAIVPLRLALYLLASILTATAVTLAGSIGFVGLIIPHMLRMTIGTDHRRLVPAAVLLGGTLLLLADTAARSVIAPQQLPVGVLTAMLGVPMFLLILRRSRL